MCENEEQEFCSLWYFYNIWFSNTKRQKCPKPCSVLKYSGKLDYWEQDWTENPTNFILYIRFSPPVKATVYEEYQSYILSAECFGLVSIHRLGEAWRQNKQSPEIGNTQSGRSITDLFSQSQIWQGISQYVGEIHQGGHQISISYPVRPIRNTSILTMSEEMDILEKVDINMNNQSCHLHRFKRTDQKDG